MKKTLMILSLIAVIASANAQWFDFSNNRNRYELGIHIGQEGRNTDFRYVGGGVSLNVWGVYLDYIQAGPMHKYDNQLADALYPDSTTFSINLGYQIPVLPWLRVMPLVGYTQTNAGYTDERTLNVDTDNDNVSLYHDYFVTPGTRKHMFNFGVGLSVQPLRWLNIYAIGSRHAIYGGLSFNLDALRQLED